MRRIPGRDVKRETSIVRRDRGVGNTSQSLTPGGSRNARNIAGPVLVLHTGREKSLLRRHPWIFASAIARVKGATLCGDTVAVVGNDGTFLATAAYSPDSQIRARVWCWEHQTVDAAFFSERIAQAVHARQRVLSGGASNAVRLVHAESDGLPGVIADRYDDTVVVQLNSAGAQRWRGRGRADRPAAAVAPEDRKSTRLNSSHT